MTSPRASAGLHHADMKDSILHHLVYTQGKDVTTAHIYDWRMAVSYAVRDRIVDRWFEATRRTYAEKRKRVYYLSLEFLIGRLLKDAVVNMRLEEDVEGALQRLGLDWLEIIEDEPDAALGNGGLGRLAACFMESQATLGLPAMGYGIRYENGLFRQRFEHGRQVEEPEDWLGQKHAWEFVRPEVSIDIGFGGHVQEIGGRAHWHPSDMLIAMAHDTPVIGWKGRWGNTLRLWEARPMHGFDLARFNRGDYVAAAEPEAQARTLSRVLYPDDHTEQGKELRLKQEFFHTAASLRDILRRFESEYDDLKLLPKKAAIQINDTHPAIAGPELVRLLHDERGMDFEEAVGIARATISYTNHTLLPEALETWSEARMGRLLPRHMQLIDRIDDLHRRETGTGHLNAHQDGRVHMGTLGFIMAHKVNGVAALHTELMKSTVFKDLHEAHPDRIVNETNGVTPRRWLLSCNPRLAGLITESIGEEWVDHAEQLKSLEPFVEDAGWLEKFAAAKRANKVDLTRWIAENMEISVDPDSVFDIQVKRIHEYKRQHLNMLETIAHWLEIRDNPNADWLPRVKIFGGKAFPNYTYAKEMVRLCNDIAHVLNSDPLTSRYLKVVFPENYNVSLAERLIPAADLSEQISTAGKEASGTGNMKFSLNGALTIGTLDGANVEIRDLVGAENFFLFGMTAPEVMERRHEPGHSARAIAEDPRLARAIDTIRQGRFSPDEPGRYHMITENLAHDDYFMVCSDFSDYWRAQREVDAAYVQPASWWRMAALNTARTGWFSSDRTIRGYMKDVWDTEAASLVDVAAE
ncbi:glycogen/starch/alpha-glucan phosphorylase [Tropicimonas sp. IMCC6043]|uniref:glycogen/starch/alpha-glucan phosphorylase n=1 Tax=Tropicimonas sp. IMCC6043 TaxID=2510645 RepID=UPI00101DE7EB|nr:glycogen/starch/alpha-glucan phosphorylase [Tropicimonas sp. IMCC6043]RYH11156.1 glycogen/starch/alpha-glucan phosphorylase [Tropicimonas sp. IMCC6043]